MEKIKSIYLSEAFDFDKKKVEQKLKDFKITEFKIEEVDEYNALYILIPAKFKKEVKQFSDAIDYDVFLTKNKKYYTFIL